MYIDEKIAGMDRRRRQAEREEAQEENKDKQAGPQKKDLTVAEAAAGIKEGKLQLEEGPLLEFDSFICPVKEIPFVKFKDFFEAKQETEEGNIYLKRSKEISQIVNWPKAAIRPTTFKQWEYLLVNGMAASRLYAEIKKRKQLTHVEYLCYEVPSGKGPVYNVMFRFKDARYNVTGNYNCMNEEKGTYGVILEAMVVVLDQWLNERIEEEQNERSRKDRGDHL